LDYWRKKKRDYTMKTSQSFQLFLEALYSAILFVGIAGCLPIVRIPDPSESVPLQSAEQYERNEATKALEQVDTSNDPNLAVILEQAKSELVDTPIALPENSIILPKDSILFPRDSVGVLPEGSFELPKGFFCISRGIYRGIARGLPWNTARGLF